MGENINTNLGNNLQPPSNPQNFSGNNFEEEDKKFPMNPQVNPNNFQNYQDNNQNKQMFLNGPPVI